MFFFFKKRQSKTKTYPITKNVHENKKIVSTVTVGEHTKVRRYVNK